MNAKRPPVTRRQLLGIATVSGFILALPGRAWSALSPTAFQPRGPFYPDQLPLDDDNDLVRVQGNAELAKGEVTDLSGRILDTKGQPVSDALVEIWQCDANGRYLHRLDDRRVERDSGFQGYGRYVTAADGRYRFRTIKPVPYPGRAPHIHFSVSAPGRPPLITQMYVAGAPENSRDWLLNAVTDEAARARLIVAFEPAPTHGTAALQARFDLVLS
jgi:protocatechuate 3,4-dioxygenase beta subunit